MLSYTQESLWLFNELIGSDAPAYNESVAFETAGELDPDALRRAVRATVLRHDALRTAFHETPNGPRAQVHPADESALADSTAVVDLRDLPAAEARRRADEVLAEHHRRPFDLGAAPLLRVVVVALPGAAWILGLTAHHLAVDDWSIRLVLEETAENYRSLVTAGHLPRRPVSGAVFREFVAKSRSADESEGQTAAVERWRRSLTDAPDLLGMPLDHPRPAIQTFRGDSITLTVPGADIAPLLKECARACRSTAFPVFLAAYALLLHRYTRQEGFAIGTTVLNRPSAEDLEQVGCYVNTLPLYVPVDPDDTFRTVLSAAQEAAERLLDDGDIPYPRVVEALGAKRARNHNPVFQTMLTMLDGRPSIDLGEGLVSQYHPVRRTAAKFDLMLYVNRDGNDYEFELEFNTDLFARDTAERILRNYAQLLASLGAGGVDAPVSAPSMTRAEERDLILGDWNDTQAAYPDGTVPDVIEEQVRRTPDALALEFDGETYTYAELNRRANQVASRIRTVLAATGSGPFVGVFMERSAEMVIALLAIVKAGCAYVPIDPEYPAARVEFMIQDAGVPLILTQEHHRPALAHARLLVLTDESLDHEDDTNPVRDLRPDSPVYMIYTSGSTGQPKGVINRHDALANRLRWMQSAFPLTGGPEADRVLQKTPYSFDVSVWEFFWPLMTGAGIVVARPGGHRDPDYLKELIRSRSVTTVHFVPSMLNVFLEAEELARYCAPLKRVVCSGEALPRKTLEVFAATLPACELHNLYGPTEAAIDVSHWPCRTDYPGELVPIGKPIDNVRLYVLDRDLRLQPVGVPGELCIGGVAVATGYHQRDELNARMFVPDPYGTDSEARLYRTGDLARFLPDGQIQYMGRIDSQVKLRGLRVEPDEIAAVMRDLPGVQDAAVVVDTSGPTQALAGYVVSTAFDAEELRARLRALLPEFLIPQYLVELDRLPTTPNGKLDRRALPAPTAQAASAGQSSGRRPATTAERDVARAWTDALGLQEPVGADSNFFALGGDSIMALRVSSRLRSAGYAVDLRTVFAHVTVAELAASLTREDAASAVTATVEPFGLLTEDDKAGVPATAEDAWPLTKLQSGMIYHSLLDEDSPVYHDIFDYEFAGVGDLAELARAVRETVAHHASLRSYFDLEHYDEPLQVVLRPEAAGAAPSLEVVDLDGLAAEAQDRVIEEWIDAEKSRPLDLTGPPLRFRAHVRGEGRVNLAFSFHHLILDGWSVGLVIEEIRRRCAGLPAGRTETAAGDATLEPSYGTYVALERESARRAADQDAWRGLLDGWPATLLVGEPGSTAPEVIESAVLEATVPVGLEERLRVRAAALGLPVKSFYLAAHCAALADLTGRSRVVTGLVGNGRPEIRGGSEMVGLFLNTLPLPMKVREADDADLPAAVFARERELVPLQRFPLADIERQQGGALFDVVFNYTDFHSYATVGGADSAAKAGVSIENARYFELTSFPMTVHVHRDHFSGGMELAVSHDPGRVKTATAEQFLGEFLAALERYAGQGADGAVADDVERAVAAVIAKVVGSETIGPEENYLDAGVDSISSIRILVKLRKQFPGAEMRDVMEARTVRALVRRLEAQTREAGTAGTGTETVTGETRGASVTELTARATAADARGTLPERVVDAYPLTATQLRMIRATRRDPAQSAYHDVFAYSVALPLDASLLRDMLRRMTAACETLRVAVDLAASPVPRQLVYGSVEPDLTVFDAVDDPSAPDAWFEKERGSGFLWERPGLIRYAAHRTAPDRFVLSLSFHHAVVDGWSLSLLIRDLLLSYATELGAGGTATATAGSVTGSATDPVRSGGPVGSFRDYALAETAARASAESREFWRDVLAGHPATGLAPFASGQASDSGSRWAEATVVLPAGLEARLREVARRTGHPLKYVLLAAHVRVLALLTGEPDVLTGVFTHGRPETDDAQELVGMFLNFQPHRVLVEDQTWSELVTQVFAFEMRALAHRRCAADGEGPDDWPRYSALFNYTDFPAYTDAAQGGGHLTGVRWFEHTDAPFLATVGRDADRSALEITLDADGRLLPQAAVDDLARLYEAVLTQISENPDGSVRDSTDRIVSSTESLGARRGPSV
ncbi:amino acid adenylation domain-containing protein [Streptomyces goshikiensis]|uniref:amino acid adenylation domain-containing protein n=1 Tax=Streptomyces goshikiensis TaxID=1942 RepID=UPI003807D652